MKFPTLAAIALLICSILLSPLAYSQPLTLFDGSAKIDLFAKPTLLPLRVVADQQSEGGGTLTLRARANVSALLPIISNQITAAIAANDKGCTERWSAWNGAASVKNSAFHLTVTVRLESWVCGLIKTRLARETGTVHASVKPSIRHGHLQFELVSFRIDDLGTLSRAFGLESIARREVEKMIAAVNSDPAYYHPPAPFVAAGFAYSDVGFETTEGVAFLFAAVDGPTDVGALLHLFAGFANRTR